MSKLFSYQRFSMPSQANGDSIRRQTEKARQYAEKSNLVYQDKSFADLGISAFKQRQRNGLESLLQAISINEIQEGDTVIIEDIDRLTRKGFEDAYALIQQIVRTGVVLFVDNGQLTLNRDSLNDLTSVIRVALLADLGHQESKKKSERLSRTKGEQREKAKQTNLPYAHKTPFWIRYNPKTEKYEFTEWVSVARKIVNQKLEGVSSRQIVKQLNEANVLTPTGKKWYESSIKRVYGLPSVYGGKQLMISNTKPDGTVEHLLDEIVVDHYPALISYEDYLKIKPAAKKQGKQADHNHLKMLVRCSKCGNAMGKKQTKYKHLTYTTYYCVGVKVGDCDQHSIGDLDKMIIRAAAHLKMRSVTPKNDAVNAEIAAKEQALSQLEERIRAGGNVTRYFNMIDALEVELEQLKASIVVDADRTDYENLLGYSDNPTKWNQIARRIIKDIVVKSTVEPTRLGKSKSIGDWNIMINQHNGEHIDLVVRGADAPSYDDIKMFKYDYVVDEEKQDIENYDSAFEMPNDYGLEIMELVEI